MSGRTSQKKGYIGEKCFRDLCKEQGLSIIWHNESPDLPDLTIEDLTCEVKYRKSIPKSLYKWLEEKDSALLAVKRVEGRGKKSHPWLVCMPVSKFFELLKHSKRTQEK